MEWGSLPRSQCSAVQLSRMEYAVKSLSRLYPKSSSRQVAVRTSVVTQQLLSEPSLQGSRARPCRVSTADRKERKGFSAHSLEDLRHKVWDGLRLADKSFLLVLEEDGTIVDTEEYFQALSGDTVFMVLQKGQQWQPPPEQDFIGCLNVKATLYDMYSLSYDLHCHGAKRIVKEALRWALLGMRATGHMLLGTSWYMQRLLDAEEDGQPPTGRASALLPACLRILH
ncbi:lipid transferase CIDEC isoform X7 [Oryctolagus cuniculus]|uniref:lipid transferase CIDEC isoform X7 n=2 Tax=Oryctolagus cuniculus TaxID=9986 RepID=UPI003879AF3C